MPCPHGARKPAFCVFCRREDRLPTHVTIPELPGLDIMLMPSPGQARCEVCGKVIKGDVSSITKDGVWLSFHPEHAEEGMRAAFPPEPSEGT